MQETKEQELPVLAVDLGGTKITAAIISHKGQVIAREYCLTLADVLPYLGRGSILFPVNRISKVFQFPEKSS